MLEAIIRKEGGGTRCVWLREPNGHDEIDLTAISGPGASRLILRLLAPPGETAAATPSSLTLSERDQLLAALHAHCFGDRIESVVECRSCGGRTDVGFSLKDLVEDSFSARDVTDLSGPDAEGYWTLASGTRFRPPRTEDEHALSDLAGSDARQALLDRCVAPAGRQTATEEEVEKLEAALERLAPLLDTQMPVTCAECGAELSVHFDIVTFFLSALERERMLVFREVHRLAAAYHWSLDEILALPRSQRRVHVALVEAEQRPLRRVG